MNERLKDLSYKAVLLANEVFDYEGKEYSEIVQKKFAELIVLECLFIIDDERKSEMVSRIELWKQIKAHFGVE